MSRAHGSQSMIDPLRRVLVRPPDESFGDADPDHWHYTGRPDLEIARQEHDALVGLLRDASVEVILHTEPMPGMADAIYVFDPAIVTDHGAVILQMGKESRRGEEAAIDHCFADLGIPVLATLSGPALAEGGDLLWLDPYTLAVGIGFRTNLAGMSQLDEILSPHGITIVPVELPYHLGAETCLHLLSLISLIDDDLAVVYLPLLSVPFWQHLETRGLNFIEVHESEFKTMATNVLALAPRKCLMLEGNPITQGRLESAGCEVMTYKGEEISLKAEGGPTCLTRPILRGG